MRRSALMLLAALAAAAWSTPPATSLQRGAWVEVRAATGMRVVSDAGEAAARELLSRIEQVAALLEHVFGESIQHPAATLTVLSPRAADGMRELVGEEARHNRGLLVAASLPAPYSSYLAVRAGTRQARQQELLLHEYLHQVTQANLPDAPAWLDEGLSEYWSTLRQRDGAIEIGAPRGGHLRTLRSQRWIPLATLMEVRRGRYDAVDGDVGVFYAQSWALVHYLLSRQGAAVFAPRIPDDLNALEPALKSHVAAGARGPTALTSRNQATDDRRPPASARQLPEAESLALRAAAIVFGARPEHALLLADRALALDPDEALALETKGIAFFLTNQPDHARQWLMKAANHPRAGYLAHYYYGVVAAGTPEIAEKHLKRVLELRPGFKPALERLTPSHKGR